MANYAEIRISAKVSSAGIVDPGVTVKFNVFTGLVQYRSFISSYSPEVIEADKVYFNTMARLGQNVAALNPAYTYSVSTSTLGGARTDTVTIKTTQYSDSFNFGTFYTSNSDKIFLQGKLDNDAPEITGVTITNIQISQETNGQVNGSVTIVASVTPEGSQLEYSINGTDWQNRGTFSSLSAGNYTAYARVRNSPLFNDTEPFEIENIISPLSASFTKSDVTVAGGADGEIDVTVDSGSGSYTYLWNDGITTQDRADLTAGDYSVEILDTGTGQTFNLYISISEPDAIPVADAWLYVPTVSSLRYVLKEDIDYNNFYPNPDNTLFADQKEPGIGQAGYCQKVSTADTVTIQLQSNYDNNTLILRNASGSEVLRIPFEKKLKLSGIQETYSGVAGLNDIGGPSIGVTETAFIYPNTVEFTSSNVVVITNNIKLNGTYTILSRGYNPYLKQEYIEINKEIDTGEGSNEVTVTFINDLRPYDVYEAEINFGQFAPGHYDSTIESSDAEYGNEILYSEPIKLLSSNNAFWSKTVAIEYQNEDNAFSMAYSTGIVNKIRIEGRFFKLVPSGDSSILRQPNGDIVKIAAKAYRGRLLETYKLPTWVHEKLTAVFQHDHIAINGKQIQTDEEYEVEYTDYSPFVSGQINVEVLGWFDVGNGHDVGTGMTETGLIIANGGYIRR